MSTSPIAAAPWGVFSVGDGPARVGVLVDGRVVDTARLVGRHVPHGEDLATGSLNPLLARGPAHWRALREAVADAVVRSDEHTHDLPDVRLHLPITVADYVDFYGSLAHATRLGEILRPGTPPLLPNWRHLPVGYHGRAGSVVVSGTPVRRPSGLRLVEGQPVFGPSLRLDVEAEVGFVIGAPTSGDAVAAGDAAAHVAGVVLLNDWSARDIQAYEYQPLGPMLGKAFATSISAWVTPLDALAPRRVPPVEQDPPVAAHLRDDDPWALDLSLSVAIGGEVMSRPPLRSHYWTPGQLVAHLTSAGLRLRTGDLLATGTVSGDADDERGSLIELTYGGTRPLALAGGRTRTWLEDGDEVVLAAEDLPGAEVSGRVLPA